ncbi:MAG: hypothetical protein Q7R39_18665, partial [Dehalococcoidia bacterium]|nr:hypothetical protein [Dehalococcoidia bacterium]
PGALSANQMSFRHRPESRPPQAPGSFRRVVPADRSGFGNRCGLEDAQPSLASPFSSCSSPARDARRAGKSSRTVRQMTSGSTP